MLSDKSRFRQTPGSRPYEKGRVRVSDGHRLYYERCGKKGGVPAVFLHGGPGTGFVEKHKSLFDLSRFDVLFFDQRGAGRSRPFGAIKGNTTWKLVEDITFLLNRFGMERAIIYGGSWGSTLALTYAISRPERVAGLVLRGIFLSNAAGKRHYLGGGVAAFAPEAWERFTRPVPPARRRDVMGYYAAQMRSHDRRIRRRFCYEWARYEISLVALKVDEEKIDAMLNEYSYESLAILESHYMRHDCFLPPNFILKRAAALSKIPVSIVHGRYDLICRPIEAYQLHKRIKNSRLHFAVAGHAASEPEVKRTVRRELNRVARQAFGRRRSYGK